MKIPEGYIEDADTYMVLPSDAQVPIKIGGRIMMNLVVREQMEVANIIATTGLEGNVCMIIVDLSWQEVLIRRNKAVKTVEGWADKQAREELEGIKSDN